MPRIDVKKRRIDAKIVYYGPGRSGKSANLKYVYDHVDAERRGRLTALTTRADPDLYVDVLTVRFGPISGFDTTFRLCGGPGQALAINVRKVLLRNTDGILFVADCHPSRREANIDSLCELEENLAGHGLHLASVPHVMQYNKCDLDDGLSVEVLRSELNRYGAPEFQASTITGQGVMESLREIVDRVSRDLQQRL